MLLLLLCLCALQLPTQTSVTPTIVIPGILASHIEAMLNRTETSHFYCDKQSDWFLIWLTLHHVVGPQLKCWADNFKLHFRDGHFYNTPGVSMRVRGFGSLEGVRYIDNLNLFPYYTNIIEELLSLPGMVEGVSLRAAPFDYRYSPPSLESKQYFIMLKHLVEETYTLNGNKQVAIISHSMGGLVFTTFLSTVPRQWKSKYLHSWCCIGGVLGGALKLVKAFVSHGVIDELPDFITSRFIQRDVARTVMSNYWLLPRYPVWGNTDILLSTPNTNYTVHNLDRLFRDMGYPVGAEKWKVVRSANYVGDPGVKTYCFNGKDIPTTASYYYTDQAKFPDSIPEEVLGDGDGTVPSRSLQICHNWNSTAQVYEYTGDNAGSHLGILQNKDVMRRIRDIISRDVV